MNDIDRASRTIEPITGMKPKYLRPPDWEIWPELAQRIEARGYHIMSKSTTLPPFLRDVDSEDYFCAGKDLSKCPQPSLHDYVLRTIEQRERKGVFDHVLVFHELPNSVEVLSTPDSGTEEAGIYVRNAHRVHESGKAQLAPSETCRCSAGVPTRALPRDSFSSAGRDLEGAGGDTRATKSR